MNAINRCSIENKSDVDGNPAGGCVIGVGLNIEWQRGPLGRGLDRVGPNGAFVETVLSAALQRILFYQTSRFACPENAMAATKIQEALMWLQKRTADREAREVEGTHAA